MLQRWVTGPLAGPILGLLFATAVGLVTGVAGYRMGHDKAADQGHAALSDLKREQAMALSSALDVAHKKYVHEVEYGQRLAEQLASERRAHAVEKKELLKRINDVTTVYIPGEGMAPVELPRCVFTSGFVREYNAALGLPSAASGPSASGASAATGTAATFGAGLRESGVTQADILSHIADYGQRCRGIEAQLGGVLDYVKGER